MPALMAVVVPAAAGCLGSHEAAQLRALNDELQRKNLDLTVSRMELEREVDRLRTENAELRAELERKAKP